MLLLRWTFFAAQVANAEVVSLDDYYYIDDILVDDDPPLFNFDFGNPQPPIIFTALMGGGYPRFQYGSFSGKIVGDDLIAVYITDDIIDDVIDDDRPWSTAFPEADDFIAIAVFEDVVADEIDDTAWAIAFPEGDDFIAIAVFEDVIDDIVDADDALLNFNFSSQALIVSELTALMGGGYPRIMYGSFSGKTPGSANKVFEWIIRARRRGRR